ncbi:hypothetical protein [Dyadobacter sp. CY323]|nr:hypothetical protein [Dyadobacter sp. CY323]MCE6993081.1 hypothetical protein [Dyadobacter sp. CY323]
MKKGSPEPVGSKLPIERIIGVATAIAGLFYVSLQALQKLVEIIQQLP